MQTFWTHDITQTHLSTIVIFRHLKHHMMTNMAVARSVVVKLVFASAVLAVSLVECTDPPWPVPYA